MKHSKTVLHYFSLVELLVVFSVILILMSLLQPSLIKIQDKAYQTKCLSTQRHFQSPFTSYMYDNDGFIIPVGIRKRNRIINNKLFPHPHYTFWPDLLESEGYLESTTDVNCPKITLSGIGMNYGEIGRFEKFKVNLVDIKSPTETAILSDAAMIKNYNEQNPDLWFPNIQNSGYIVWRTPNQGGYRRWPSRIFGRHNGKSNITFLDGSASSLFPSEIGLQFPKNHKLAKWDK